MGFRNEFSFQSALFLLSGMRVEFIYLEITIHFNMEEKPR
jgi:hypothetical protein